MKKRLVELLNDYCIDADLGSWEKDALADYLIASGVIVPPCKVGDLIFSIEGCTKNPIEFEVLKISYNYHKKFLITAISRSKPITCFDDENFGVNVFLTYEEAKRALAERKGK